MKILGRIDLGEPDSSPKIEKVNLPKLSRAERQIFFANSINHPHSTVMPEGEKLVRGGQNLPPMAGIGLTDRHQ
jgi:hypothetical protein